MHDITTSRPPTDPAALARRIQSGDRQAEEELVEHFDAGLALLLRRLTDDPSFAEDLHQETFRIVLQKLRSGELREPDKLAAYLRGTARNLLLSERKKQARLRLDGDAVSLVDPPRGRLTVEAAQLRNVLRREESHLVRKLLGEMRFDRDRQILAQFYLSDRTKQEICRDLEVDASGFKKVLFRARERLRELWDRAQKRQRFAENVQ